MVKKLFKHEFISYARIMTIIYGILLTIATASRMIQFFENDSIAYAIISVFSGITYGISVLTAFGFSFVLGIIRFYRNLFTGEGYLSFTLPVTSHQHIAVKVITAVSVNVITFVMVLLSVCIITAGEMLKEIGLALGYILEKLYELAGFQTVLIGGELVVLLLVASFTSVMLYYTFIAIGQLFKKNRILAAVGAYFVYYIATQIISAGITILFSLLATGGLLDQLGNWIKLHPYTSVHIGMGGAILLAAIFALVEYLVIKRIITKKLNLE